MDYKYAIRGFNDWEKIRKRQEFRSNRVLVVKYIPKATKL